MSGLSIESGCLTGPGRFCRTILRYSQDGRLAQMLQEKYTFWYTRVTRICKPKYIEVLRPLQMLRTSTARLSHILALQSGFVEQSAPSAGNTKLKRGSLSYTI